MITEEQMAELKKPLSRDMVRTREGGGDRTFSYVEAWRVIARANEVFGFDGWSHAVLETGVVQDATVEKRGRSGPYSNRVCVVRAVVRVTALGCVREDIGIGVGEAADANAPAAIELAWKVAVTDGMKRALRSFGHQFGLALYDRDQEFVGASSEATRLIEEVGALPASSDALAAWRKANEEVIANLHVDDGAALRQALDAKRTQAVEASLLEQVEHAGKLADLQATFHAATKCGLDRAAMDRIVERCKARKAAIRVASAASANGHANGHSAAR